MCTDFHEVSGTSIFFCHHVLGAAGALDCLQLNQLLGVGQDDVSPETQEAAASTLYSRDGDLPTDRLCWILVLLIYIRARYRLCGRSTPTLVPKKM